jgi:uncharacterized membrane protein
MAENDDEQDESITFEDSRNMWIFVCFVVGLPTLLGFLLRYFNVVKAPATTEFPFEPWSLWFMFAGAVIVYGFLILVAVDQLSGYWQTLRYADRLAFILFFAGMAIALLNFFLRKIVPGLGMDVPSPTMSVVMVAAGCLFLFGKYRATA